MTKLRVLHQGQVRTTRKDVVQITALQAHQLVRLLGVLQDFLECSIECMLIPGTNEASVEDQPVVRSLRRDWKSAETFIRLLETKS